MQVFFGTPLTFITEGGQADRKEKRREKTRTYLSSGGGGTGGGGGGGAGVSRLSFADFVPAATVTRTANNRQRVFIPVNIVRRWLTMIERGKALGKI